MVQLLLAATVPPLRLIDVEVAVAPDRVPLQLFVELGVVATCRPAGKLSVTARPVRVTVLPVGLVMVMLSVVLKPVPTAIGLAANDLLMVGGISTATLAEAVPPVPPLVELTLPVVLVFTPDVVLVILTEIEQLLLVAMVPPVRLSVVSPTFGEKVPPQVLVAPVGEATLMPPGRGSLTATPLCATVLADGLVMVMVSVVVPLSGMLAAPNDLVMVSADIAVRVAEAVVPVPPLVALTVPVVLTLLPAVVAVTFTEAVHVPPTAMVPPLKLIELAPALGLKVGVPQPLVVALGVEATCTPDGKESLTPTPASAAVLAAGLVIVNVSVEVPPTGMLVGKNALVMVGAVSTVKVSVPVLPVPPFVALTVPVVFV